MTPEQLHSTFRKRLLTIHPYIIFRSYSINVKVRSSQRKRHRTINSMACSLSSFRNLNKPFCRFKVLRDSQVRSQSFMEEGRMYALVLLHISFSGKRDLGTTLKSRWSAWLKRMIGWDRRHVSAVWSPRKSYCLFLLSMIFSCSHAMDMAENYMKYVMSWFYKFVIFLLVKFGLINREISKHCGCKLENSERENRRSEEERKADQQHMQSPKWVEL